MSTLLKDTLQADLKAAMLARDKSTVNTFRLIMAAIKLVEVNEGITVEDDRIPVILDQMVKQRLESLKHFEAAGRADLVEQENFELSIIKKYLPAPLSQNEIEAMIAAAFDEVKPTRPSDMGKLMAILKPQMQGRADLSQVNLLIKQRLATS